MGVTLIGKESLLAPFSDLSRAVSSRGALNPHSESLRRSVVEVWMQRLRGGAGARSPGDLDLWGINGV